MKTHECHPLFLWETAKEIQAWHQEQVPHVNCLISMAISTDRAQLMH